MPHKHAIFHASLVLLVAAACGDDSTATTTTTGETATGTTGTATSTSTSTSGTTSPGTDTDSSTGSTTTTSSTSSGTTESTGVMPPTCGNGVMEGGEECDDGNADDTDACTNACTSATCGDGVVQAGVEECDDGNADDTDACVAGCLNATCGDGFVGPGETCDDGNTDDADECTNACAPASCGDMVVQGGVEECDDGNMDDTDACLTTCKNAVCGDGKVQAMVEECDDMNAVDTDACLPTCKNAKCGDGKVYAGTEQCDDGNMSDADMCTNTCKTPTCMDMAKNGTETDADCGGMCMTKCALTKGCAVGADCMSNYCAMNVCAVPPTCAAIKTSNPNAASGVFQIDPDGNGPVMPFNAYCDMTTDGGGWTIFYANTGGDNQNPMVGDTEVVNNNPLMYQHYNLNRQKKVALSAVSTQTLIYRNNMTWLRANAPAFNASLLMANQSVKAAIMLTSSNNMTIPAFMGWSNYNISGGGDFGISQSPDGNTCAGVTVTGFDHHSATYRMLNCGCQRHYFYNYSAGVLDSDGGYDANLAHGNWAASMGCNGGETNHIVFYAAMR